MSQPNSEVAEFAASFGWFVQDAGWEHIVLKHRAPLIAMGPDAVPTLIELAAVAFLLLSLAGCAESISKKDARPVHSDQVTIEQQLAVLADMGIIVSDGVGIDDLTEFKDRHKLESQPYSGLVELLGYEIEREPFTPMCSQLWMCDYERIEDHGDYKSVVERLELMTGHALGLSGLKDYVDVEEGKAWVEFTYRGETIHWDAEVDNDWLDPQIIVNYYALLRESRSPVRIYSNHTDYGQAAFFAALTREQKSKLGKICKIELILLE